MVIKIDENKEATKKLEKNDFNTKKMKEESTPTVKEISILLSKIFLI